MGQNKNFRGHLHGFLPDNHVFKGDVFHSEVFLPQLNLNLNLSLNLNLNLYLSHYFNLSTRSAMVLPMDKLEVAAGEGALTT